jgi:CBS domain-containing protein
MPIAVGDLVQNQATISVAPSATLAEALNIMIEHDFSQLPILDKQKKPIGMVTSTSIARALLRFGAKIEELSVSDATVRIPDFPADEDLLFILDNILQHSVVLIVDASKTLIGILTEYDTTQYFRQRAEDIVLVEDIEGALKGHLLHAYDSNENESAELRETINSLSNSWDGIRKKIDSCIRAYSKANNIAVVKADIDAHVNKYFPKPSEGKAFKDLTLSEFIQLAQKHWSKFELTFNISSATWGKMIDEVREIRNKLVHFRGDISPVERHSLRFCVDWFKAHPIPTPEPDTSSLSASYQHSTKLANEALDEQGNAVIDTSPTLNTEAINRALKIKYAEFVDILRDINPKLKIQVNFLVSAINEKVKGNLPQAARQQATWWTDVSAHSQQWLEAGWQVTRTILEISSQTIVFRYWPSIIHEITEPWQVTFWSHELACSEQDITDSIKVVGPSSDIVAIYVKEEISKRKEQS